MSMQIVLTKKEKRWGYGRRREKCSRFGAL